MSIFSKLTDRQLAWLALLYFVFNALTQLWVSATVDIDQSEQMLLSQTLQWGYNAQPPLYTYLVWGLFQITGVSLYALTLFKAVQLAALAWVMLAIGRELHFSPRQQTVNLLGLAFIPQIIWHSQRDMTHSVLVTLIAATTLWQLLRLYRAPSVGRYLLIGLLVGLGLLSKYNYLFFIAALFLAALILPTYRHLVLHWRALAGLAVAVILVSPHLSWALTHFATAVSGLDKVEPAAHQFWRGLGDAAIQLLTFCAPMVLLGPAVWFSRQRAQVEKVVHLPLLVVTTLIILIFMVIFIYISDAQTIKERWFQPLYFYFPLIVASHARDNTATRVYVRFGIFLVLLAMLLLPLRTVFGGYIDKIDRPSMPYPSILQTIAATESAPSYLVADGQLLGGNVRNVFTTQPVLTPVYPKVDLPAVSGTGLAICHSTGCAGEAFQRWLTEQHLQLDAATVRSYSYPYYYAPDKGKMTMSVASVRPML